MEYNRFIRCYQQLISWVDGSPKHNSIDNECCPDFSCCHIILLSDLEYRLNYTEEFKNKYKQLYRKYKLEQI